MRYEPPRDDGPGAYGSQKRLLITDRRRDPGPGPGNGGMPFPPTLPPMSTLLGPNGGDPYSHLVPPGTSPLGTGFLFKNPNHLAVHNPALASAESARNGQTYNGPHFTDYPYGNNYGGGSQMYPSFSHGHPDYYDPGYGSKAYGGYTSVPASTSSPSYTSSHAYTSSPAWTSSPAYTSSPTHTSSASNTSSPTGSRPGDYYGGPEFARGPDGNYVFAAPGSANLGDKSASGSPVQTMVGCGPARSSGGFDWRNVVGGAAAAVAQAQ
jgi:hypothetical protein